MSSSFLYRLFAVSSGGLIGALLRYGISSLSFRWTGNSLWGILFANLSGSFGFALLSGLLEGRLPHPDYARLFLMTGLLGSFTTFSTFSFDTLDLFQKKMLILGSLYLFLSIAGSILVAWYGWNLGKSL